MFWLPRITIVLCLASVAGAAHFQTDGSESNLARINPGVSSDDQIFRDSAQAFVDAYAARDAEKIGGMFATDAEFLDEFGIRTIGREAIVGLFSSVFESSPQAMIEAIDIERIRHISPQVVLEEGRVSASDFANGPVHRSRYVALHRKGDDGVWRINTLKDFPREPLGKNQNLDQLEWMIGDWVNEDGSSTVSTTCRWSDDGNYLLRRYELETSSGIELDGVQRIGWDPQRKQLRSWNFDSQGGFREGFWIRKGSDWIVTSQGTTADGRSTHGTAVFHIADPERIIWTISSLVVGNEILPANQSVIMMRAAPKPLTSK